MVALTDFDNSLYVYLENTFQKLLKVLNNFHIEVQPQLFITFQIKYYYFDTCR